MLRPAHSRQEQEVLSANTRFYRTFAARDVAAMQGLWAREHPVACVHPGWEALHGREEVLASFQAIMENPDAPEIEITEATPALLGDSAFVTCVEQLGHVELVATNLFVREDGDWKLVLHQAAPFSREPQREPDISELN